MTDKSLGYFDGLSSYTTYRKPIENLYLIATYKETGTEAPGTLSLQLYVRTYLPSAHNRLYPKIAWLFVLTQPLYTLKLRLFQPHYVYVVFDDNVLAQNKLQTLMRILQKQ